MCGVDKIERLSVNPHSRQQALMLGWRAAAELPNPLGRSNRRWQCRAAATHHKTAS